MDDMTRYASAEQLQGTALLSVAGASPRPFGEDQRSIRVKSERGCNATRPGQPGVRW